MSNHPATSQSRRTPHRPVLRTLAAAAVLAVVSGCSSPDPAPARAVASTTDDAVVNDVLYRCLMDKGFAVTRGDGGAIEFKDPDDVQRAAYDQSRGDCLRTLEIDGTVVTGSSDTLVAEYAAMTRLHTCLGAKGLTMDAWPTEAVFVEKQGGFNVLSAAEPLTMERAEGLCPDEVATLGDS